MDAVFHLDASATGLPSDLVDHLALAGLRASRLDPTAAHGPLSGWYRIESPEEGRLQAAVQFLQRHPAVDAAYVKPKEGPPA